MSSISYFVTYSEPQTRTQGGRAFNAVHMPVSGMEHREPDAARRELQELAARTDKPLQVTRHETFF